MRFLIKFNPLYDQEDQEDDPNIYLFYLFGDETEIKRVQSFINDDEGMLDFVMDMESDYGTLDTSSNPDWDIEAFTTVEVEPKNHLEVMNKFRDYFINEIKTPVGPIKGPIHEYPTGFNENADGTFTPYEIVID